MTDTGYADKTYVCGPDCKAIKVTQAYEKPAMPWWEKILLAVVWTFIVTLAVTGALDVGVRIALHCWNI